MKPNSWAVFLAVLGWCLLFGGAVRAEHRATHLGHPATRFADPLKTSSDLRKRFRDERLRLDIARILEQAGWTGNLEDLYYAALTAEVTEIELPVGTRMPYMSSRENGRPIALFDVVWAGKAPVGAYEFYFSSNGRKYRCVTPKPCSNFFVVDLGAELPVIEASLAAPAAATVCDPYVLTFTIRNTGPVVARGVKINAPLPDGLQTDDHYAEVALDAGDIPPGNAREIPVRVRAVSTGDYTVAASVRSAEGVTALAEARTGVTAPVLALECDVPRQVFIGMPAKVCLTVRNVGSAPEREVRLALPVPEGFRATEIGAGGTLRDGAVVWEWSELVAGASENLCLTLEAPRRPGVLNLEAELRGRCAPVVQSRCSTRIDGVPGILVEVVDAADPVEVGEEVTYLITVTNQGLATLTAVQVVAHLAGSQEFVSATGTTPGSASGGTITFETLPELKPLTDVSWRVVAKAQKADDARFGIELRSAEYQRPILEMESTQQY